MTEAVAAATAAAGVTAMTAGRWVKGVAKGLLDTRGIAGAAGLEGGGTTTGLGVGRTALTGRCGTPGLVNSFLLTIHNQESV